MQLPGLVHRHSRKLHLVDVIFAVEGAHPRLRVRRIADSAQDNLTEGKTVPIAAYAHWHLAAMENESSRIAEERKTWI